MPKKKDTYTEREKFMKCVDKFSHETEVNLYKGVLQEFYEDVKTAFGTGRGDKLDSKALDWPDLEVTFHKASAILYPKKKR